MPRRAARRAMVLAALAFIACGRGRRPPPERFVPAAASGAVILPELGRAASGLAALHASLSAFPGAGSRSEWRRGIAAQLGFDPLDPEALAGAGLDPKGGAAVALLRGSGVRGEGGSSPLVVLPAGDPSRVEKTVARLAQDRFGATERTTRSEGGVATISFRRPGSEEAALTYAIVERSVLLAPSPEGPAVVSAAASLAPPASLAGDAAWKRARAALGDGPAAIAWAPPGSPLFRGAVADGAALGLTPGAGRLTARAAVLLGSRAPTFRALAAGGRAAPFVAALDPAAPLVGRWDGDFAALGHKLVPLVPEQDRDWLAKRGVDLERDVFGVLGPGGVGALTLSPRLPANGLTSGMLRADPLRALEVEAVVPALPGAEVAAERIARAIAGRPPRAGANGITRVRTPSGEIAWKVEDRGARLVLAVGRPGRLDALLARLAAGAPGWKAPTAASAAALEGGLGGAILDVPRLVAAVRALPDEAFGGGPSAFVMRSLLERFLDPASRLAAISLRADLAEDALLLSLDVEAAPGETN